MSDNTISFVIKIDGKDAVAEMKLTEAELKKLRDSMGITTGEVEKHGKSVGGLAGYIREQRMEQRQANFLINDFRDALNLAGMAMNGMAAGGSREFKQLTDSVNVGLVAFNGIDAVTGLLPGPMGLVMKLAGGIGAAVYTWANSTDKANESIKQHLLLLDQMNSKYDETRSKMTGSDRAVQETARLNAEVAEKSKADLESFLDEAVNGQKVEERYMGQRVTIRRKGLGTIKDLEKTHLTEYQLYLEEYRKATSEGKTGDDARSAALEALKTKVQSLVPYIAGLRAIANEGGTTGIRGTVDALSEALALAKSLGDFKAREVTFISEDQAKRFADAIKQAQFLEAWMKQAPAERADLVQENWLAQFKQLQSLGKETAKEVPVMVRGLTDKMQADLQSFVQFSQQIMGIFTGSVRAGFEAAFSGQEAGLRQVFKGILIGVIDLVQGLLIAATAAAELKGILTFFSSFAGDFPLLAAATVGLQGLRAFVATAFAEGGMVTRPTLAMIGEGGEPELIGPTRTMKQILLNDLIPEVVSMARSSIGIEPGLAVAGIGSPELLREFRGLRRDWREKDMSTSLPGLVTFDKAFGHTSPRIVRQKARERK